ncbi:hypothetical protein J2W22_003591 [Sphingomonas kyeonggiensis]|uniref:hypothetical protein n=1 Tax=Sphingomonas kyeonggiensis TaxID=1268553 RepID=UPI00278A1C48|nr:hypothetical protein [Sphingomonas kyeonggiensis]MDQ0251503.1 hypothetical protein [Sphingomonas kyeonggiensis]
MSVAGAYGVRKRDAVFARLWEKAVARAGAERVARLSGAAARAGRRDGMFGDYRKRHDGWTEIRTRIFLRALAETGCVRDACARAHISDQSAYRMRRRDAKFAAAWEKALDESVPTLEQAAWERAVEGWDEIVWKDGVEVSRKRRYSDGLLKFLLDRRGAAGLRVPGRNASRKELVAFAEAAAKAAGGFFGERADPEDTNRAILKKLEMIDRARAMEAAEDAEREAARTAGAGERDEVEDWEAEGEEEAVVAPPPPAVLPRITGCPGG